LSKNQKLVGSNPCQVEVSVDCEGLLKKWLTEAMVVYHELTLDQIAIAEGYLLQGESKS
jgi:hypothetical protein